MHYIEITLESDLCVASGESGGNTVDSDICIDAYGLPYIPARRIKGCLRQAAEELKKMGYTDANEKNIVGLFGNPFGTDGSLRLMDGNMEDIEHLRGCLWKIKNEKNINSALNRAAHPTNIERLFSSVFGSTRMSDGVKVDNTLRFTRVLRQYDPLSTKKDKLVFRAPFYLENKKLENLLEACCRAMRHIGLNRNRGMGDIRAALCLEKEHPDEVTEKEESIKKLYSVIDKCGSEKSIIVDYMVSLEEPVSIPGLKEYETVIPGRSVIGCMAKEYLKESDSDAVFKSLFLNGTVIWSCLTPVVNNCISNPTPFMIMKLKNGGGRMINRYAQKDQKWTAQKPKTIDGSYAARTENGYVIVDPVLHMFYHHSIQKEQLYIQNALEAGMIYGGKVIIRDGDKDLAKEVVRLLTISNISFGRSKGAQYATCKIKEITVQKQDNHCCTPVETNTPVFVILESDLMVRNEKNIYVTHNEEIRKQIADAIMDAGGSVDISEDAQNLLSQKGFPDVCQYKTIGGYHTKWQLQKPHIPAVQAGSVYCFVSNGTKIPKSLVLGDYTHEGFGRCSVCTLKDLEGTQDIQKGMIDREVNTAASDRTAQLKTAMRVFLAKDVLRRYAREYEVKERSVPVSRLRLMLSEASSYQDLCTKVGTMKTSDRSSVNEKGKKVVTENLLQDFYGNLNGDPLAKILKSDPDLYKELENDKSAMHQVCALWKLPLDQLLHNMHYTKGK